MGPDSEASVASGPVAQPPAAPPPRVQASPLAPITQPRRGLALIAVGMGVAIVAVVVLGVKLLSGPKNAARPPVAVEVAKPAPQLEPVAAAPEPSTPTSTAEPKAAPKPKRESAREVAKRERQAAKEAKAAAKQAKLAAKREQAAAKRAQVAAKRDSVAAKRAAARQAKAERRTARRASKVALHEPAAKAAPAPSAGGPRPLYEKGNALLFSGDGKGAIVAYREAVRLAPHDPIGFRGLGLAYEQQGETSAAVKTLRRYLKLAPGAPDREIIGRRIERLSHRAKK
jgi:tetratricopeptide (TPR) repeat protein